jgi:hypothetical protein
MAEISKQWLTGMVFPAKILKLELTALMPQNQKLAGLCFALLCFALLPVVRAPCTMLLIKELALVARKKLSFTALTMPS